MQPDHVKNNNINRKEKGFTVIEVLIAIGILAFGLLAIASMQVMAIKTNGKANRITEAATIAMDNLEQLRTINNLGGAIDPTAFPSQQGYYTVQVNPGPVNSGINAGEQTVTVTISGPPQILKNPITLTGVRTSGI